MYFIVIHNVTKTHFVNIKSGLQDKNIILTTELVIVKNIIIIFVDVFFHISRVIFVFSTDYNYCQLVQKIL